MPTVIQSNLAQIVPAVAARLVQVTGLPAERVIAIARDTVSRVSAEQYIFLRPRGLVPDVGWTVGIGRTAGRVTRLLEVRVDTRLFQGAIEDDSEWLYDPVYGHYIVVDAVYNALFDFAPIDGQNNWLLTEPIKIAAGDDPAMDNEKPGWGSSKAMFEISYLLKAPVPPR